MKKRILCLVLVLALVAASVPVYAAEAASYGDFISNASRRGYVEEKIATYLACVPELISNLNMGKPVVFLFEGASDNLDTINGYNWASNRVGAVCIVLRKIDGKIVRTWYSQDCSTIPDRPLNYGTKDATHGPATTVDGVYDLYTVNHHGVYAAMNVRVDGNGYFPALYMSQSGGYDYITASSINVHTRIGGKAVSSDSASPWSAGCILIGTSKAVYDDYLLEVNNGTYGTGTLVSGSSQYSSYLYSSTGTYGGKIVIDRVLAESALVPLYQNSAAVAEMIRYSKNLSACPHESYDAFGACESCGEVFDWESTYATACEGFYTVTENFAPWVYEPYVDTEVWDQEIEAGETVEVLGEYENAHKEKWYRFLYKDEEGYAPAEYLEFSGYSALKVECEDFSPENQTVLEKKSFPLTGTVKANYPLAAIHGYLDGEYYASWYASNENTYQVSLQSTDINYDLTFGALADGRHTVKLVAESFVHDDPVTFHVSVFYTNEVLQQESAPGKPVLELSQEDGGVGFAWEEVSLATHYELLLEKQTEYGWELIERVSYAESGILRALEHGAYRAKLIAYNCGAWDEDGFGWANASAEEVSFCVHQWLEADCVTPVTCGLCQATQGEPLGHSFVDGVCGVCGEQEIREMTIPTLRAHHASVSFEDEIWYNLYFTASDLEDVDRMGLLVFDTFVENGRLEQAVQVIDSYDFDGTYYMAHTDGIAAKKMGDTLYFRVYALLSDGTEVYSDTVCYDAIMYANSILRKSENPYMKALVVSMLNYGAQAQLYFGYNTGSLMNAGLTAQQQALALAYGEDTMPAPGAVDSGKNGIFANVGFGKSSITASFDAAFAMNYYVNPTYVPEGDVTLYYWTEEAYASAEVLSPENASGAVVMTATGYENQFFGTVSGIAAKEMEKTVYAGAVYESGGVTYSTVVMNYSMGKYCDTIAGRESSNQRELSMAAAVYGASARDYFENF